MPYFGLLLL